MSDEQKRIIKLYAPSIDMMVEVNAKAELSERSYDGPGPDGKPVHIEAHELWPSKSMYERDVAAKKD